VGLSFRFRSAIRALSAIAMVAAATLTMALGSGPALSAGSASADTAAGTSPAPGYWVIGQYGGVWNFGAAPALGSIPGVSAPLVAAAATPTGRGLWLADSNGRIYTLGDAVWHGDLAGLHLNKPVVGMSATRDGGGYWMVAGDGGIFTFGDAVFHGSLGSYRLNKPVVAMATTPSGGGYWMVASDGGIFTFGDARFFGSEGSVHLNQPVIGMSPTADGLGYWLVATDGGVFTHGDAPFAGSLGSYHLNKPITSMTPTSDNRGYWLIGADGGVFTFGDAPFVGSLGSNPPSQKVVFLAPLPPGGGISPAPTPVKAPPPNTITVSNGPNIVAQQNVAWSGTVATFQDSNAGAGVQSAVIDWGDGHTSTGSVSNSNGTWSVSSSHIWATPGNYTVTASVADNGGGSAKATGGAYVGGQILVSNTTPSGQLPSGGAFWLSELCPVGGPALVNAPSGPGPACGTQPLAVGKFHDANAALTSPSQFQATIDWKSADGQTADTLSQGLITGPDANGYFSVNSNPSGPACTFGIANSTACAFYYRDEGQYFPIVTVHEVGSSATFSDTVGTTLYLSERAQDVWDAPHSFSVSETNGTVNGVLAVYTDAGSNDAGQDPGTLSSKSSPWALVQVDYGDGTVCNATNMAPYPSVWTDTVTNQPATCGIQGGTGTLKVFGNHTYNGDEGTVYTIKIHVIENGDRDTADANLWKTTATVTLTDADSYSGSSSNVAAVSATPFTGPVATFTDTNAATTAGQLAVSIDWGDGTALDTTSGSITLTAGTFTVNGTHTYALPGSFHITVTVGEPGGTQQALIGGTATVT
jgi:hypothetical protein